MRATRKTFIPATLFAAALALSGCVTSDLERAGIGAVAGGVTAAAFNGSVGTGILIGAAGGALCDDAGIC
jgi:hypothetical protein